uniref:Lipoprotein n=1 Tax=Heterorhabditis bacteriophora TaxID=37862 RepID=A0A1I7W7K0_HETBA
MNSITDFVTIISKILTMKNIFLYTISFKIAPHFIFLLFSCTPSPD